jgi:crotonobetainyl-CoA:carnitine CoA-transferase CaiB-like acyl-CoA transferase
LAGPYATYQLGLLGADVIRVENPIEPDQTRTRAGDQKMAAALMGTSFMTQSANKRSLNLNLKSEAGCEILKKLVSTADIMVENFRPGAMASLGLGYEDLARINPKLIYVSMSAFGQVGPRSGQTASDHIIQATSGLMAATGTPETSPMITGAALTDYATGMAGAFAIASALLLRNQTGRGQHVDVAMCDVAMALLNNHAVSYLRHGTQPKPNGNSFDRATIGTYETKDGLVMLAAVSLGQQRRLWKLLGRPDLIKSSEAERYADHACESAALAEIMRTRSADEWEEYMQKNHVPAARIRTIAEAIDDPHTAYRGYFQRVSSVPGIEGEIHLPLTPFRLGEGGPSIDAPPARMGQHTFDILTELGLSQSEIDLLQQDNVLGKPTLVRTQSRPGTDSNMKYGEAR